MYTFTSEMSQTVLQTQEKKNAGYKKKSGLRLDAAYAATFSMNRSSINHYKVHYRRGIAFP